MGDFFIIAPLSALSKRTRLYKLTTFLFGKWPSLNLTHIAWERLTGECEETYLKNLPIQKDIVVRGGGYGGAQIRFGYLSWVFKVFFRCLKLKKSDTVWALGFESAFPAVLASKLKKFTVIFDDADRFSMLLNFPRWLNVLVERLEVFTSRNSKFHLVPGLGRYDFESKKIRVIKNTPSANELKAAFALFESKQWPAAGLVLNVNGWLGNGRGMGEILVLAKEMIEEDFRILLAGDLSCDAARELALLDNVTYLGNISNAEALASYYASDLVYTYYAPSSKINRFAESNKWGDAIMVGVGVVVNGEVETADYLREAGAAISLPYNATGDLIAKMKKLCHEKSTLIELKLNAKKIASSMDFYEIQLDRLFSGIDL